MYLIKSISAVTNYNSSSCLILERVYFLPFFKKTTLSTSKLQFQLSALIVFFCLLQTFNNQWKPIFLLAFYSFTNCRWHEVNLIENKSPSATNIILSYIDFFYRVWARKIPTRAEALQVFPSLLFREETILEPQPRSQPPLHLPTPTRMPTKWSLVNQVKAKGEKETLSYAKSVMDTSRTLSN